MGETLSELSRTLIRLHQRIEGAAPTVAESQALTVLGDGALKHQFVVGVQGEWVRHELRQLMLRSADIPFTVERGEDVALLIPLFGSSVVDCRTRNRVSPGVTGQE